MARPATVKVDIGDVIKDFDARSQRVVVKRCTGLIKGPAGGIQKVLYVRDGEDLARQTLLHTWLRMAEHARAAKAPATAPAPQAMRAPAAPQSVPFYRRARAVAALEPKPEPLDAETRDVLMTAVQRRCKSCPTVFLTRVVSVEHCPECRPLLAPVARREGGA